MLYVQLFAEKKKTKNCSKGTSNVLQGGCQRSMVKDHIITFFWDPSLTDLTFSPCVLKICGQLYDH